MKMLKQMIQLSFLSRVFSWVGLALIRFYQLTFSPAKQFLFGPTACCRFYPSCSDYAHQSVKAHGLCRGSYLTAIRLIKCGPWHAGGVDEVPLSLDQK